ncbi:MAG: hypothetical protein OEL57_08390 [Trichlorobacter sp.]|uniref:hypothetical protein n=1 Tax=Trichlorobacter sp. TaxID=2911007 RepID=UPI002562BF1B|nr:hypothetical protein [Trichlorobacter sp.]MDK9717911.1 hypothetical protein [Trichlorobacter sp.]
MTEIVFDHEDFDFETMEEELKADEQCQRLLQQFYIWLQQSDLTPEHASELAYSADYYLRDYVIDFLQRNALRPQAGQVHYFAGNWYITRTLEPEMAVLARHLEAIAALYRFMHALQLISPEQLDQVQQETADLEYYQQRVASFLALAGEGYEAWDRACQLEN